MWFWWFNDLKLLVVLFVCRYDVLSLQFNLEQRDRSRREYVLLEDPEVSEALLSLLTPIIQHNKETLSLINRVEVVHLTYPIIWVFDWWNTLSNFKLQSGDTV